MIWLPLAGPALLAVAFTLLPGLVIAWVAGLRGFAAVALAPVLSVTSISVGAILGGLLRVPWGWWIPVGVAALMSMVVWSIRHATRRKGMDRWWTGSLRDDLPYWVGLALAIGLMARQFLAVTQRPDWFAQRFDNLFHLSAVRYIVQTSDASSLTLGRLTSGDVPVSFYPAAFHDGASLVLLSFPESLTVAVNAMLFALVVVVWPVSCLA
ncbi:MAG: hypothetical protein L0G22_01235, partial [Propionibacteriaceae bacterium]|nr:hypothetical protein [Propionibacteriaceae bacterium]